MYSDMIYLHNLEFARRRLPGEKLYVMEEVLTCI